MKTVEMIPWQRIMTKIILESLSGLTVKDLRITIDLIEKLELSDEEKKLIELTEVGNNQRWKKEDHVFGLDFEDKEYEFIAQKLSEFRGWRGSDAKNALDLCEKFGVG